MSSIGAGSSVDGCHPFHGFFRRICGERHRKQSIRDSVTSPVGSLTQLTTLHRSSVDSSTPYLHSCLSCRRSDRSGNQCQWIVHASLNHSPDYLLEGMARAIVSASLLDLEGGSNQVFDGNEGQCSFMLMNSWNLVVKHCS